MAPLDSMTRPHLQAIDLVRFFAAALVVWHHYATMFPIAPPPVLAGSGLARDWAGWSWSGWVGVEIFFVVSGYVIALSAMRGDGLGFLRRRALRLGPAAWACATISAAILFVTQTFPPVEIAERWLTSMIFWPIATQIDWAYWTLGIEVAFYLLIATQLGKGRDNTAAIERIGLLLAAASAVFWVSRGGWASDRWSNRGTDLILLTHGAFFASGIALWSIREFGASPLRLLTLTAGAAAGSMEITAQSRYMATGLALDAGPAVPLALFAGAFAVIAAAGRLQPLLERWLGTRLLAFAGRTTYPLYLIHGWLGATLIAALLAAGMPSHAAMLLAAGSALLVATLIMKWIEPALREWLARRLTVKPLRAPLPDNPATASPSGG